jgi:hypothetical protein
MNMNIRQAARWAERKGALVTPSRFNGEPLYMYAVYDLNTHMVDCIGGHDKCSAHLKLAGAPHVNAMGGVQVRDGRWLRMTALIDVVDQLDESEGEARCAPSATELAWGVV